MHPPYIISPPQDAQTRALLINSPHSGRDYEALLRKSRLSAHDIRRSEDMYVDELFARAPSLGANLFAAHYPRAYLDLNRAPEEWDSQLIESEHKNQNEQKKTSYVLAGLGVIARVIAEGVPIYDKPLSVREANKRLDEIYHPYHKRLTQLVAELHTRFGALIMIDAHSMPAHAAGAIDIALGNRHGESATDTINQWLADYLTARGFRVGLNHPFAGGHIVGRYGKPQQNIHAVQIEIARALYMNETTYEKTDNFMPLQKTLTTLMSDLITALPQLISDSTEKIAAE